MEWSYGSLPCVSQNPRENQGYKQPSREKVKPLIELQQCPLFQDSVIFHIFEEELKKNLDISRFPMSS